VIEWRGGVEPPVWRIVQRGLLAGSDARLVRVMPRDWLMESIGVAKSCSVAGLPRRPEFAAYGCSAFLSCSEIRVPAWPAVSGLASARRKINCTNTAAAADPVNTGEPATTWANP